MKKNITKLAIAYISLAFAQSISAETLTLKPAPTMSSPNGGIGATPQSGARQFRKLPAMI